MKQTIRLTESELRGMIEESVCQMIYEGAIDEISWKGIGNMFRKGGQDLTKVAQNVGGAVVDAAKDAKSYVQNLGKEYKAGASEDKINKISSQLDKWFDDGVFGDDKKGYIRGAITRLKDAIRLTHNANYTNHTMDMGSDYAARQARNKRRQENNKARKNNLNQMDGVA